MLEITLILLLISLQLLLGIPIEIYLLHRIQVIQRDLENTQIELMALKRK